MLGKHGTCLYPWRRTLRGHETELERREVRADNAGKQGQCTLFLSSPLSHLASTKGCYATAIYTRAPFPSRPPSSCQAAPHENQMELQPFTPSRPFLSLSLSQIWPGFWNPSRVKTVLAKGKQQGRSGRKGSEMSPRCDITLTAARSRMYMHAICKKECMSMCM